MEHRARMAEASETMIPVVRTHTARADTAEG